MRFYFAKFLFFISLVVFNTVVLADPIQKLFGQTNSIAGNPYGKVTVVEFFDYQCSHCMNMASVIDKIIRSNKDVRIVFKDLPMRGDLSELASKAALAASRQGKYYELNHALLSLHGNLNEDVIYKIAEANNLDMKQFKRDMKNDAVNKSLDENVKLSRELNVSGTPAFFIGKTDAKTLADVNFVLGEMSLDELENAINRAAK